MSSSEHSQEVLAAKKRLIHVANWQIMDERHRKLDQIDDSVTFLRKICGNVLDHPTEEKYRKIKLLNPTFCRHVRDAPGGEAFMKEAGWHIKVQEFEKLWVYEWQPGSLEWVVLEEAVRELDKLAALVADKRRRAAGDKKAETQRRLDSVRAALEEDKAERAVRFQQGAVQTGSQQQHPQASPQRPPGSPRAAGLAALQRSGSQPVDPPDR